MRTLVGRELLDDCAAEPRLVRQSLRNIARANRWFGGLAAVIVGVDRLLEGRTPASLSLLDVGTGSGDIPRALRARWTARGTQVRILGVERHQAAAEMAQRSGLLAVVGDGLSLGFKSRSVDVVLLSQIAHHFDEAGVIGLAREAARVARIGVVVADLRRSRLARAGFRIGAALLGFDAITRVDGMTSLDRGFDDLELTTLIRRAGFEPRVTAHWGSRLVATWSVNR